MNRNVNKKIIEDVNNNKGVWNDVILEEIRVYYGVFIMMDIIKLDREDLYWKEDENILCWEIRILDIISRDWFM